VAPFIFFLGGGSMSHVSASAFGAAVLYAALRARDGSVWWGVAAGAAVGLMVSDRPLVGLVLGTVFTLGLWSSAAFGDNARGRAWFLRRAGATVVGGAPFAVFLGWFNQRLHGSPFTLGYVAAFGDRHRLGSLGIPLQPSRGRGLHLIGRAQLGSSVTGNTVPGNRSYRALPPVGLSTPQGGWGPRSLGIPPGGGERILLVPRCTDAVRVGPGMDHTRGDRRPGVGRRFERHPRWAGHCRGRPGRKSYRPRTLPRLERLDCGYGDVGYPVRGGRRGSVGGSDPVGQLPMERGDSTAHHGTVPPHGGSGDRLCAHVLE
jgi:hypothetical protein